MVSENILLGVKCALTACAAVAILENLLVIGVLTGTTDHTKDLRLRYYGFVFNLALADLFCAVFAVAFTWNESNVLFALFITGYFVAILTILAVAVNRYLAFTLMPPARYDSLVTTCRLAGVCVLIWVVSLFVDLFPVFVASDDVYRVIEGVVKPIGVFVIWLATATLYFAVYRKVRGYASSLDASLLTERIDKRVRQTRSLLITFSLILLTSFVCWMPFSILEMILFTGPHEFDEVYYWFSGLIYVLSTVINPLIYWWRFDGFRRGFRALLCRCFIRDPSSTAVEEELHITAENNL